MLIDFILISVALIWLIFASISDIKSREVPDWLNFSLIIIALALKLMHSIIAGDISILLYALAALVAFFLLANLMYYTKQWGGGDAKLVIGLGVIFAQYPAEFLNYFNPELTIPFAATFVVNLFIVGAVYGIIYSLVLAIKHYDKLRFDRKLCKKPAMYIAPIMILILITSYLLFNPINYFVLAVVTSLFSLFLILILARTVEQSIMIKTIPIKKLTEGDWLYKPVYCKNKLVLNNKKPSITKEEISLLKRYKIKSVVIKEGIPFVPAFLIATIISLIFGNFWLII